MQYQGEKVKIKARFARFAAINMAGFETLKEGKKVSFDIERGPKGKQALNIQ